MYERATWKGCCGYINTIGWKADENGKKHTLKVSYVANNNIKIGFIRIRH